jgi:rare lipoprotein A
VLAVVASTLLVSAGCSEFQLASHLAKKIQRESDSGDKPVPKPQYKVGKPYQVAGVWYYPKVQPSYDETGIASWYGAKFHGKRTANGDVFDMNKLTAAHKTLPMPTRVRVTNLENGRSLVLLVNDRGPFAHGRIIDVSRRAAQLLGFQRQGTAKVRVTAVEGGKTVRPVQTTEQERKALPALPRGGITANELAPPPGVKVSARPAARATAAPVRIANSSKRSPAFASGAGNGEPVVEIRPVKGDPTMFVQAGAFADATNAVRLRARLSYIGNAKVSTVIVKGRELFRVRIGPLTSLRVADQTLNRVLAEGIAGAKIIVD